MVSCAKAACYIYRHLKIPFTNIIHDTRKQHRGKADCWCRPSAQEGLCCGGTGQLRPHLLRSWECQIQCVRDSCPSSALPLLCSPPQGTGSPPAHLSSSHRLHINTHTEKHTQQIEGRDCPLHPADQRDCPFHPADQRKGLSPPPSTQ